MRALLILTGCPLLRADKASETVIGEVVLDIDDLKKYYEVSANALFSSKAKKLLKQMKQ